MLSVNGDLCTRFQRCGNAFDGICSELSADNLKKDWARITICFTHRIVRFRTCGGSEIISKYLIALPSTNHIWVAFA
jgi:hypothetical protein